MGCILQRCANNRGVVRCADNPGLVECERPGCATPTCYIVTLDDLDSCGCQRVGFAFPSTDAANFDVTAFPASFGTFVVFPGNTYTFYFNQPGVSVDLHTGTTAPSCDTPEDPGDDALVRFSGPLSALVELYNPVPSTPGDSYSPLVPLNGDWLKGYIFQADTTPSFASNPTQVVGNANTCTNGSTHIMNNGTATIRAICTEIDIDTDSFSFTNAGGADSTDFTVTNPSSSTSEWFAATAMYDGSFFNVVNGTVNDTIFPFYQTWLTITSATSGTGDSTITFSVAANGTASDRTAYILINNKFITINQSA